MHLKSLLLWSEVAAEIRDDLDETWHHEREECHTSQHDYDAHNFLNIWNRVEISVAHRRKSSYTEIANRDEFLEIGHLIRI